MQRLRWFSRSARGGALIAVVVATAFVIDGNASTGAASAFNSHNVAKVLLRRYGVLRTSRVSFKTLPRYVVRWLDRAGPRLGGLDTSDVGEAQPAHGAKMWLIPGASGYCGYAQISSGGGGGSCGLVGSNPFGPGTVSFGPGGQVAWGFVPDGIASITAHLAGGATFRVRVNENTYVVKVPHGRVLSAISAVNQAGRVLTLPGG